MKTESLKSRTQDSKEIDYAYSFSSSKSASSIYELLLQPKKWWTGFHAEMITGQSERICDEFEFFAGDGVHYSKHKLIELVPAEKIVWEITAGKLTFIDNTGEWIGTKLIFSISDQGAIRRVNFVHEGLIPGYECYGNCSDAWTLYMKQLESNLN